MAFNSQCAMYLYTQTSYACIRCIFVQLLEVAYTRSGTHISAPAEFSLRIRRPIRFWAAVRQFNRPAGPSGYQQHPADQTRQGRERYRNAQAGKVAKRDVDSQLARLLHDDEV